MASTGIYMQFGSGLCGPENWLNFDVSPTLRLQRLPILGRFFKSFEPKFPDNVLYGDIVRGLPVTSNSCDAIYCSHVLEHLSLVDFRIALKNCFEYLRPNGRFRFVLPDLEYLATDYVENKTPDASLMFMRNSHLGVYSRPKGIVSRAKGIFGNSMHLWMWDYKAISCELAEVGFSEIRRAIYGDSGDFHFDSVEDSGRWENCLGVDCRKLDSRTSED